MIAKGSGRAGGAGGTVLLEGAWGVLLMSCAKSLFQQLLMNSTCTVPWLGNS